jgi:NDP-sugar pyrophosphorylase family protein
MKRLFGHGILKRQSLSFVDPTPYDIPSERQVSVETEVFRRWLAEGRSVRAFMCQGRCFEIGTRERNRNAQNGLAAAEIDAGATRQGGSL